MSWLNPTQLAKEYAMADYSLLNVQRIREKWKRYEQQPPYKIDGHMGAGCSGDPPGFSSYFLQSIYINGDSPRSGPQYVIRVPNTENGEPLYYAVPETKTDGKNDLALMRAWLRPPLDHPRTQAWILSTFQYQHHMYKDPSPEDVKQTSFYNPKRADRYERNFLFPFTHLDYVSLNAFEIIDEKWRQEFIDAERTRVANLKAAIDAYYVPRATPDNHAATVIVRRYYPEFVPTEALIHRPRTIGRPGNWWARMAERPSPETCPGEYGVPHPVTESWCQQCGWHAPPAVSPSKEEALCSPSE